MTKVWPLCLKILLKETWILCISSIEGGVASVSAGFNVGGVASAAVNLMKKGMVSVHQSQKSRRDLCVCKSFKRGVVSVLSV